jgi:outer membrane protein OmpA-like peptidoglycan-associated protein
MNKLRACLKTLKVVIFFLSAALMLAACGPTTQVILLPDPDGKVGSLEVYDKKVSQTLDKPWQSTETSILTRSSGAPKIVEEKQVKAIFQQALEAEPLPPANFIMQFKMGSVDLTVDSLKLIPDVLEAIRARKSADIIVSGHTDSVGSDEYDRKLSLRRARAVTNVLVARGVNRENIEVTYHGKKNPLIPTPDGVPEPRNRRVEITVR